MRNECGKRNDNYITLDQYLVYNDKVYHGTELEKVEGNFKMVDLNINGQVDLEEFHEFWA
jgi:Ca2+-binding EF-hand superfamily protein